MNAEEIARITGKVQPGAKRKRDRLKPTPVMLHEAERRALDAVAEQTSRSRSDLIREAVRVWLKKGAKQ